MQSKKIPDNSSVVIIGMGMGDRYIDEEINEMLNNRSAVIDFWALSASSEWTYLFQPISGF